MASIEEKVEEHFKTILDGLGIRRFAKTESINKTITEALQSANSKCGGTGNNYPDIQLLLDNGSSRRIPVMIEAKGSRNRLEKLSRSGQIELVTYYEKDIQGEKGGVQHHAGDPKFSSIVNYAVNGAVHYANALLNSGGYDEVIAIGVNGKQLSSDGLVQDAESKAYYISRKNNCIPKHIPELDRDWSLLKADNLDRFYEILDRMTLTEREIEDLRKRTETTFEAKIKSIHQSLYDDDRLRTALTTNEKLYLFCGLIMGGLKTKGVAPLEVNHFFSNDDQDNNDSKIIITRIRSFLKKKKCDDDKIRMILELLQPVFDKEKLWKPINGESIIKGLFKQVKQDIIPCLESNLHLDFTGKILNSLGDWVHIENDSQNDVVLTPRYVTTLMAKLARTNMNSYVWDRAMGSAGFLVSAMDIMIKDAKEKIADPKKLEEKIEDIHNNRLLGVEILGNIYILAVLNMILMGDGSSNIYNGDGHDYNNKSGNFPATVFLLNPPYSAAGKGFIFVDEALKRMTDGYACILIQENAGSGYGLPYTKQILKKNTLCASIRMSDIFLGKASVKTAIYLFQVNRPHEKDDLVTFIDFSNDGYARLNRKKSSQEVNLRDVDHAVERYAEIEAIVLGKKPETQFYTEKNGLVIRDVISLEGNDWTFAQHQVIDTMPKEEDLRKTVADYWAWRFSRSIKEAEKQEPLDKKAVYQSFRIGDLFDKLDSGYMGTGEKIGSAAKEKSDEYCIPLTCAKTGDNGVMYWGKKGDFRTHTNAISIIADGAVSAGLVYAQPEEAGAYSHSYFIKLKHADVSYRTNLYLASMLNKVLYPKYSREQPPRWNDKVENDTILLPVTEKGEPDYNYMDNYIRKQEKLVIQDAVQLTSKILEEP